MKRTLAISASIIVVVAGLLGGVLYRMAAADREDAIVFIEKAAIERKQTYYSGMAPRIVDYLHKRRSMSYEDIKSGLSHVMSVSDNGTRMALFYLLVKEMGEYESGVTARNAGTRSR